MYCSILLEYKKKKINLDSYQSSLVHLRLDWISDIRLVLFMIPDLVLLVIYLISSIECLL